MLYIDGEIYDYGFSLNRQQVCEEWLMQLTKNGFITLFTRVTDSQSQTKITIEDAFEPKDSTQRRLAEVLTLSIQENQRNLLFLHRLYENGIARVAGVFNWFKRLQALQLQNMQPARSIQCLPCNDQSDSQLIEYMASMLRSLKTGVTDISLGNKVTFDEFADKYAVPNEIMLRLEATEHGLLNFRGQVFLFAQGELSLVIFHHPLNSDSFKFNLESESHGTQHLVSLLAMLFSAQKDPNLIYVVDNFDHSLHPILSQFLIEEFSKLNPNGFNQLLLSTHDLSLLSLKHFREEEIWFVEKNQLGESKLKPLSDFDFNPNSDLVQDYLFGRFGAIPVLPY